MRGRLYTTFAVLKLLVGVALLPLLVATFFVTKRGFLAAMGFLWPHLDIYTPQGELYLRRWFFWPKLKYGPRPRFLHWIRLSDLGRDPHDHPGEFTTTILWNGYDEEIYFPAVPEYEGRFGRPGSPWVRNARAWETYVNPMGHTHAVKLIGETLTWVVGWKKGKPWGFWVLHPKDASFDRWVESEEYGEKGDERKSWTIDGK